jgi:hypothetical protein
MKEKKMEPLHPGEVLKQEFLAPLGTVSELYTRFAYIIPDYSTLSTLWVRIKSE